ncbi:MAG: hypothetical protein Kow00120_17140 [Anaerolineae bacterium]
MINVLRDIVKLALLWPLALVSMVAVKLDSDGPILVNDGGPRFRTTTLDGQTTRLGRYLQKAQLDNLPQLFRA